MGEAEIDTYKHTYIHISYLCIPYNTNEVDTCSTEGQVIKCEGRALQEQDEDSSKWKLSQGQYREQNTEIMKI